MKFVTSSIYNDAFAKSLGPLDELIRKYSLILAGSSVPANILGDTYPGSDFDVYTCVRFKMRNENEVDSPFDDEVVAKLGGVLMLAAPYRNFGKHNYKYICPNFTINIINVSVKYKFEIYDHIYKSTDLDICASTYNGFEARFPANLLERKMETINHGLIDEIDKIPKDPEMSIEQWDCEKKRLRDIFILKRTSRAVKYIDRKFTLDTNLVIDHYNVYNARIFNRLQTDIEASIHFGLKCLAILTARNVSTEGDFVLIEDKTSTITARLKRKEIVADIETRVLPGSVYRKLDFDALKWAKVWVDLYDI